MIKEREILLPKATLNLTYGGTVGTIYDYQDGTSEHYHITDGDATTFHEVFFMEGGYSNVSCYANYTYTWDAPMHISKVYLKWFAKNGSVDKTRRLSWVKLQIDGVWTQIQGIINDTEGSPYWPATGAMPTDPHATTIMGNWDRVTGVSVYLYLVIFGSSYFPGIGGAGLFLLEVFTNPLPLYYWDGNAIREVLEDSSSPIKIFDGVRNRGISLLDTSSPGAGPVRLYNGSAVKSLGVYE